MRMHMDMFKLAQQIAKNFLHTRSHDKQRLAGLGPRGNHLMHRSGAKHKNNPRRGTYKKLSRQLEKENARHALSVELRSVGVGRKCMSQNRWTGLTKRNDATSRKGNRLHASDLFYQKTTPPTWNGYQPQGGPLPPSMYTKTLLTYWRSKESDNHSRLNSLLGSFKGHPSNTPSDRAADDESG